MVARHSGIVIIVIVMIVIAIFASCSSSNSSDNELSDGQIDTILNHYIESNEFYADKYLESKWFVNAEVFEVDKTDKSLIIYATIADGQYAKFENRAYMLSGSIVPTKLTVEPDSLKILKVEQPEDGDNNDSSLKELFTGKAYMACKSYDTDSLWKGIEKKVTEEWNVEVNDNYQLDIDDDGNYTITVIDEDGSNGKPFEIHIEKSGQLEPIK
ncbi:MAG: hypothetical protein Q4B78_00220 [Bacillota bacterium]|nr:hypothetical protein [Bacillota bacterium]